MGFPACRPGSGCQGRYIRRAVQESGVSGNAASHDSGQTDNELVRAIIDHVGATIERQHFGRRQDAQLRKRRRCRADRRRWPSVSPSHGGVAREAVALSAAGGSTQLAVAVYAGRARLSLATVVGSKLTGAILSMRRAGRRTLRGKRVESRAGPRANPHRRSDGHGVTGVISNR